MTHVKQQAKERPILFSGPMVRAILEGRKTQTRRVVKGIALEWLQPEMFTPRFVAHPDNGLCPYGQPGDRLWVRETWGVGCRPDPIHGWVDGFEYRADCFFVEGEDLPIYPNSDVDFSKYNSGQWRPSIHMPRVACRILLEVTSVRVERLQDISEGDAIAEGVSKWQDGNYKSYTKHPGKFTHAKDSFRTLWESINGPESWNVNPWVWVVEFKKIEP